MSDQSRRKLFELASRIDELCDEFETQWKSGTQPGIEDFLQRVAETERGALFRDLLVAELELQAVDGKGSDESSYTDRFPEFGTIVAEVFRETGGRAILGQLREYELQEKLGEGGMGVVYRAMHGRLKRTVAIKTLPPEKMDRPEVVARFHREMEATGQLDDPHIVRAHDAGEVDGTHFLVMEFVDGLDLRQLQERTGPLSVADACEIIRQAALGLQSAADAGLVHRDIKPANLMLTNSGIVKILDLGLAQITTDTDAVDRPELTSTGQIMGTFDFLAPEQATDTKSVDVRADIYALGCTLFKLLTGQAPYTFDGPATPYQRIRAHLEEPIPSARDVRADVPETLDALFARMLAKQPADRITPPSVVAEQIAEFCAGHDLPALLESAEGQPAAESDTASVAGETVPYVSVVASDASLSAAEPESQPAAQVQFAAQEQSTSPTVITGPLETTDSEPAPKRWRVLPVVIALALAFGLLAYLSPVIFSVKTDSGTIVLECDPAALQGAKVEIDGEEVQVTLAGDDQPLTIGVDKRRGQLRITKAGFKVFDKDFEIALGDSEHAIQVRLEPLQKLSGSSGAEMTASSGDTWLPGPKEDVISGLISRPASFPGIKRWQIETTLPRTTINAVAYSPDGKLLACGCESGHVRIYHAETLQLLDVITAHTQVLSVAWSGDGQWLASGGRDYFVHVWNSVERTGTKVAISNQGGNVQAISWAPDDNRLVLGRGVLDICDISDGGVTTIIDKERRGDLGSISIGAAAWSPDGQSIAIGDDAGNVAVWDVAEKNLGPITSVESGVTRIAWSPDGLRFATGQDRQRTIHLWRPDGTLEKKVGDPTDSGGTHALAWNPQGTRVVSAHTGSSIKLDDVEDTSKSRTLQITGHSDRLRAACWHPDGTRFVTAVGSYLRIWSDQGEAVHSLAGTGSATRPTIAWSHDGRMAAVGQLSAGLSGSALRIFSSDGRLQRTFKGYGPTAWHPIDPVLGYRADAGSQALALYDPTTGTSDPTSYAVPSIDIAWSPDGSRFIFGHFNDGKIEIWKEEKLLRTVQSRMVQGADSLSWAPDGQAFVTGAGEIWSADGELIASLYEDMKVGPVAWSPEGKLIAALPGRGRLSLWDPSGNSGRDLAKPASGTPGTLYSIDWSPDSRRLVTGGTHDGTGIVNIWSVNGARRVDLREHEAPVMDVAWSPTGRLVSSAAQDGTAIAWDAETLEPDWITIGLSDGNTATFSAAGQLLDGDPGVVEDQFVYIVDTSDGEREILKASEFHAFVDSGLPFDQWRNPELVNETEWQPGSDKDVLNGLIPRPAEFDGIKRWQVETHSPRTGVHALDVSPDGKLIACGCASGLVRIYDAETLALVDLIHGQVDRVSAVAWSPDGKWLAFDDFDAVHLWNVREQLSKLISLGNKGDGTISWSPDSSHLAIANGIVRVVEVESEAVRQISQDTLNLAQVGWSPDGAWIAAGGYSGADGLPGNVVIWDAETRKKVATGEAGGRIECLKWHFDSQQFATSHNHSATPGDKPNTIRIWNLEAAIEKTVFGADGAPVYAMSWSPDGSQICAAGTNIRMIDLDDDSRSTTWSVSKHISDLCWNPHQDEIVTTHGDGIRFWQSDGTPLASVAGSGSVSSFGPRTGWSQDGSFLAVSELGRTGGPSELRVLSAGGKSRLSNSGSRAFAWHPGRAFLAAAYHPGGDYGHHVVEIDVNASRKFLLVDSSSSFSSAAWSPDGERITLGHTEADSDGAIEIRTPQGDYLATAKGHGSGRVNEISWSPDSKQFASAGIGGVRVWNADGTEVSHVVDTANSRVVAWSPQGDWIATTGSGGVTLFKPDGTKGPSLRDSQNCQAVAWSPDGERLIGGHNPSLARVWSKDGQLLEALTGQHAVVTGVDWSPTGQRFASVARDCTVIVWDGETYEPVWVGVEQYDGSWASFTSAGQVLDGKPKVLEEQFVYVVENEDGSRELMRHSEFIERVELAGALDRKAAEWVLSVGGEVTVSPGDGVKIDRIKELPDGDLQVESIDLTGSADVAEENLSILCDLKYLTGLSLRETSITDAGLVHVGRIKSLKALDLTRTAVTGAGMQSLEGLLNLENINLIMTEVTDQGFASLARLTKLNTLNAHDTPSGDDALRHIAGLTGLRTLSVGRLTTDGGLAHLAGMKELESLGLTASQVAGPGLATLSGFEKLIDINLSSSQITDEGLPHLANIASLRAVNVSSTEVSDDGIEIIARLQITQLVLLRTNITTAAMDDLSSMKKLEKLDLLNTSLGQVDAERLSKALPRCEIIYGTIQKPIIIPPVE